MLKWLTGKTVAYALLKVIKEKKIRHEAIKIAKLIDKLSAKAFGEKRSEKIQAVIIKGIEYFTESLIKELKADWGVKK